MPTRLVYAPKAYVFTKSSDGTLYNLSPYVTAGSINRLINQVSTASVTLRNPYRIFTTPSKGVAFHPMDPITIYLERIAGFPVRVFTGYLDSTPYYQLQPTTVTLTASCTLKRLLYTYFDPSLPYVIAFFEKYGWINTGQGSIISSQAFNGQANNPATATNAKPFDAINDGSIAKMLWAVLFDIAEWDDTNIYIEAIPGGANGIVARMELLMQSFAQGQEQATNDFTTFLQSVIGSGTQGSGGGNSNASGSVQGTIGGNVNISGVQKNAAATIISIGKELGANDIALEACICGALGESNLGANPASWTPNGVSTPGNPKGFWGLLGGSVANFPGDPHDFKPMITSFFKGGVGYGNGTSWVNAPAGTGAIALSKISSSPGAIAAFEEDSGKGPDYYGSAANLAIAKACVQNFQSTGTSSSIAGQNSFQTSNSPGTSGLGHQGLGETTQQGSTAPAGKNGAIWNGYANPLAKAKGIAGERIDQGVDYSMTPGSPILSMGNCTLLGWPAQTDWYQGQPIVTLRFDDGPLQGKIYYLAEEIDLAPGLKSGDKVQAGQTIATYAASGTGIETGWAASEDGTTLADTNGGYTEGDSTQAGINFNEFLKAMGAPSGVLQATTQGSVPSGYPSNYKTFAGATITGGSGSGSSTGNTLSQASSEAFVAQIDFPSIEDQVVAIALGAEGKGLMHDQSVLPFVQQLTQASLRSFMSLPTGDFFAFYPDYFGEMGHRAPYWFIDDIEIMSGTISLTDDALATHVYAVGDNTWPVNDELLNELFSAGTISIFNAFLSEDVIQTTHATQQSKKATEKQKEAQTKLGGLADVMNTAEAVNFVKRFGARPLVQDYPMVRSPIFEMLMAYQLFMQSWANQFLTPFTFTFMPELFPGGKVGFPSHGIQMYINSVTHTWDYSEGGFTTTAELSAPSLLPGATSNNFPDLPPQMVQAMAEPVKNLPVGNAAQVQGVVNQASPDGNDTGVQTIDPTTTQQIVAGGGTPASGQR